MKGLLKEHYRINRCWTLGRYMLIARWEPSPHLPDTVGLWDVSLEYIKRGSDSTAPTSGTTVKVLHENQILTEALPFLLVCAETWLDRVLTAALEKQADLVEAKQLEPEPFK